MAKSEVYKFKGTASWAKVFEENRDMMSYNEDSGAYDLPHPGNGRYSIELKMSTEDYRILKMTGSVAAKNSKIDMEDASDLVKLGRDHERRSFRGDIMDWISGPPVVVDKDGNDWDLETMGMIGNGSEVEVTIDLYKTKFSPRTTLMKVKVLDLITYERPEDSDDESVGF